MNLRENVYLIGATSHQIVGSKLPSNKQVLSVLFYNLRDVKLSLRDSTRLFLDEIIIFWQKARIPTREVRNCVPKLESMYEEWRKLQKSAFRRTEVQIQKENEFVNRFDDLFDIAHSDALNMIKIDLDKQFLIHQRQKGRPGSLIGVDLTTEKKEVLLNKQIEESEKKRKRNQNELQTQFGTVELESSSDSGGNLCQANLNEFEVASEVLNEAGPSSNRGRKHFITAKLVTVLDKCKISDRDATHLLMATAEALGHTVDSLRQIFAVVRGTASLPCDIAPPIPHDPSDTVTLVIWYKDENTAIYSVDIRSNHGDPKKSHWRAGSMMNRSNFRTVTEPTVLTIDNVSEMDAGIYRCRVDFRMSPTQNTRMNLTVIVPPEKPVILSEHSEKIEHTGPYFEGDRVRLTCMVTGGRPEPMVRWWRGETLVDTGNEGIAGQYSTARQNELTIAALSRQDQGAVYTCQASNSNLSAPVSTSVTIEMFLKPLEVQVLSSRQPLSAGRTYEIQCQAVGSKPPANITWWKDNERLINATQTVSPDGNVTSSTLIFSPTKSDNGKSLVCRAENSKVQESTDDSDGVVEDSWTIDVHYVPLLKLALGTNMNPADIEEGDDVYFECKIDANPPAYKVIWKHNGQVVQGNVKSGVIMNQKDMALQNVKRQQAGNYSCLASNVEGDGESNVVRLTVMYKPVCKHNQKLTYGVSRNENTEIVCEVDAYPAPDHFKWTFNRTGGAASEMGSNEMITHVEPGVAGAAGPSAGNRGKLSSVLTYNINNMGTGGGSGVGGDNEYGTVTCRASNTAGQQIEPCVFHLIAAVKPDPPFNCTSGDRTLFSVRIWCSQGFDGGVPQRFALEAYDSAGYGGRNGIAAGLDDGGGPAVAADGPAPPMLANMTADRPDFTVRQLTPSAGLRLAVYAYNSRGTSDRTWLTAYTLNSADKQTTSGSSVVSTGANDRFRLTPVVAGLLAVTIVSTVAAVAVMCALRVRSRRHRNHRRQDACIPGTGSIMGGGTGGGAAVIAVCKQKVDDDDFAAAALDPDQNPDLIPPTKIKGGSRGNIGYRVVQQQPMPLNGDDDENLDDVETSDDERAGYPTLPVDGLGSRPSVNSLRHAAAGIGAGYSNNGYRPEQHMTSTTAISSRLPPYHRREIVTVRTPLMSSQQESCV